MAFRSASRSARRLICGTTGEMTFTEAANPAVRPSGTTNCPKFHGTTFISSLFAAAASVALVCGRSGLVSQREPHPPRSTVQAGRSRTVSRGRLQSRQRSRDAQQRSTRGTRSCVRKPRMGVLRAIPPRAGAERFSGPVHRRSDRGRLRRRAAFVPARRPWFGFSKQIT